MKRRFGLAWIVAALFAGAIVGDLVTGWLLIHVVELSGGQRQTRPPVAQQDLLKLQGASDEQSEIEMRTMHGRLMERIKAEYDRYLVGERKEPPVINLLVISSGGDYGAFGAGFLKGWQKVPPQHPLAKPEFDVVTGVSAGG